MVATPPLTGRGRLAWIMEKQRFWFLENPKRSKSLASYAFGYCFVLKECLSLCLVLYQPDAFVYGAVCVHKALGGGGVEG